MRHAQRMIGCLFLSVSPFNRTVCCRQCPHYLHIFRQSVSFTSLINLSSRKDFFQICQPGWSSAGKVQSPLLKLWPLIVHVHPNSHLLVSARVLLCRLFSRREIITRHCTDTVSIVSSGTVQLMDVRHKRWETRQTPICFKQISFTR